MDIYSWNLVNNGEKDYPQASMTNKMVNKLAVFMVLNTGQELLTNNQHHDARW